MKSKLAGTKLEFQTRMHQISFKLAGSEHKSKLAGTEENKQTRRFQKLRNSQDPILAYKISNFQTRMEFQNQYSHVIFKINTRM